MMDWLWYLLAALLLLVAVEGFFFCRDKWDKRD